jgi:hypothetical protein
VRFGVQCSETTHLETVRAEANNKAKLGSKNADSSLAGNPEEMPWITDVGGDPFPIKVVIVVVQTMEVPPAHVPNAGCLIIHDKR